MADEPMDEILISAHEDEREPALLLITALFWKLFLNITQLDANKWMEGKFPKW